MRWVITKEGKVVPHADTKKGLLIRETFPTPGTAREAMIRELYFPLNDSCRRALEAFKEELEGVDRRFLEHMLKDTYEEIIFLPSQESIEKTERIFKEHAHRVSYGHRPTDDSGHQSSWLNDDLLGSLELEDLY